MRKREKEKKGKIRRIVGTEISGKDKENDKDRKKEDVEEK